MTYELALKLKEAGFPQSKQDTWCYWNRELVEGGDIRPFFVNGVMTHTIIIPTLEELIDACGEDFNCLMQEEVGYATYEADKRYYWRAGKYHLAEYGDEAFWYSWSATGETRLIAVANLYLALKNK